MPAYANLAWAEVLLERRSEAAATLQRAVARHLEFPDFIVLRCCFAFLDRDDAAMARAAAMGTASSGVEDWMAHQQAAVLAHAGRLREARTMTRQAVALALQSGGRERAALYEAGSAVRESLRGAARQAATDALALSTARDVEYGAALALALAGEAPRARTPADDLEARFPDDTLVRFIDLPTLRALVDLQAGGAVLAVDRLQLAVPRDLAFQGGSFGSFGSLYTAYVRGLAWMAADKAPEAAGEFRTVLAHPGLVLQDPVGIAARVQLARALARSGDHSQAAVMYREFLDLFNHADQDVPLLGDARVELARLHPGHNHRSEAK
ncbi:hypothetical protein [Luteitalea pratensis]|uniref:hypothetical protein n=1 Tax=Luteitalea pratensis TaxID=1855912 RepID=UPI000A802CC1|nr:hypothetical protein [Luteitalea pratensis]